MTHSRVVHPGMKTLPQYTTSSHEPTHPHHTTQHNTPTLHHPKHTLLKGKKPARRTKIDSSSVTPPSENQKFYDLPPSQCHGAPCHHPHLIHEGGTPTTSSINNSGYGAPNISLSCLLAFLAFLPSCLPCLLAFSPSFSTLFQSPRNLSCPVRRCSGELLLCSPP